MPRYALEVMPLGFVLVAAGLAELVRLTAAGVRLGEARIARAVRRGPA
jgi:hypothetical protein